MEPVEDPDDGLLVRGFGFGGYRSIRDLQFIGPMKKINVLVGRNNVGKSNILRFLNDHYSNTLENLRTSPVAAFAWRDGEDRPIDLEGGVAGFAFCRALQEKVVVDWALSCRNGVNPDEQYRDDAAKFLVQLGKETPGPNAGLWQTWLREDGSTAPDGDQLSGSINEFFELHSEFRHWFPQQENQAAQLVLRGLRPELPVAFDKAPIFIPAIRQIGKSEDFEWDGSQLISLLADISNPSLDGKQNAKKKRWEAFKQLVRAVLEDETVSIRVPPNDPQIIIEMDGRELAIGDLGTGVHEVLIIAAAATASERTLFLLEEPENHLHPLLQRRLLTYLAEETSNQYVIATHSAHFLDFEEVAVFSVKMLDGWTCVDPVETNTAVVDAARNLGYRPSDLLQTNSVIWVEGPTDRIYLRYWISKSAPGLVEGIDYSIMFYGGRLASHVSGQDSSFGLEEGELIELRRINRRSAIVIDSDRTASDSSINETKERLRTEFESDGFAWVTEGREIENYVLSSTILEAIKCLDRRAVELVDAGDYGKRWLYRRGDSETAHKADKVKLAKAVLALEPSLDVLDLEDRIAKLVTFIRG